MKKLSFLLSLSLEEKIWLVTLLAGSQLARLALFLFPLRVFRPLLGTHYRNETVNISVDTALKAKAHRMGSLMQMTGNREILETKCLPQAITIKRLLNRYDIPAVFYLGATLDAASDARILSGLVSPTAGSFLVDGVDISPEHKFSWRQSTAH